MSKYFPIVMTLFAVCFVGLAYSWVYNLDPADPIVPFACCFVAGMMFRQALVHVEA